MNTSAIVKNVSHLEDSKQGDGELVKVGRWTPVIKVPSEAHIWTKFLNTRSFSTDQQKIVCLRYRYCNAYLDLFISWYTLAFTFDNQFKPWGFLEISLL